MTDQLTMDRLVADLRNLGILSGDIVLVRASLSAVGRVKRSTFLDALLQALGSKGTLLSLAVTSSVPPWRVESEAPFQVRTPSYAGALPNMMLEYSGMKRSTHPQTSFVAIGPAADELLAGHDPHAPAYEPVRRLIELRGKMLLVGCAGSSPGFTTTHVAEADLGMGWRLLPAWWFGQCRYIDGDGSVKIFKRRDGGFCSNSYWKFYAAYVRNGLLRTGRIGNAYSVLAPAPECYAVEKELLAFSPRFNVCDSPSCFTCNVQRLDRWHHLPAYLIRRLYKMLRIGK